MDLPGGQTQVLNVRQLKRIDLHPAQCDESGALERISDTKNWLHLNGALENSNGSNDIWEADIESGIELGDCIEDPESPDQRDVSAAPNVPRSIRPTRKSNK